ncbi:MAG: NADH-quinone oxidoreductase subunit NuoF [Anaerolineae bacterium CFX3]|nr:NADH-quinone oxidoreductase subunit NuoF [Anaerolineae bacterium CFX3]MCQ3946972.1 NADH-quinone oxidoreductase subunit NuoF [Anaerolineae bacterium]RIK27656.1 MAG: NADH-quinone oxidoreductase subunit NuoF [Anaerolineae bacterium]
MNAPRALVLVSNDPASVERGSEDVFRALQAEIRGHQLQDEIKVSTISSVGEQDDLPLVMIYPEGVVYGPISADDVRLLVEEHLIQGHIVRSLVGRMRESVGEIAWLRTRSGALPVQQRVVLGRVGIVDPESLDDYLIHDGYAALGKALFEMTPQQVIAEVDKSGLQGRGGAGFPTGRKWEFVRGAGATPKYIICNADESEPGTFKDRMVIEGDPFSLIEAMTIAAYAVGAAEGYIYIRGEYKLGYQRLENAIQQAEERGLLGDNIFGKDFNFHIHLHAGAGAYICGEETALIESIEGKRGQPRARPPYPPTYGVWGKPTAVNNVETLANVPPIIRNGGEWYIQFGTEKSRGTKIYTIMGNVNFTGVIEVPLGITLREVIDIYGQGMKKGGKLKLAQTGGSSGSIVPASLQDTPMDFESWRKAGVSLGSGALLICDEHTCVVDLARTILNFFHYECCAKCVPCRMGTHRLYEIMNDISIGRGDFESLAEIQALGLDMEILSNCGLGQTASVAVRDILKHFRAEVEEHIRDGVCRAGVCKITTAPIYIPREAVIR